MEYRALPELHFHKHLGFYIAFGVRAYRQHRLTFYIPDVFSRWTQAKAFVQLCNKEQPELIHLNDIIEDAI